MRGGTKEIVEGNFLKEKEMWKIKKKKDKKFRENITIFTDSSKKEAEYPPGRSLTECSQAPIQWHHYQIHFTPGQFTTACICLLSDIQKVPTSPIGPQGPKIVHNSRGILRPRVSGCS